MLVAVFLLFVIGAMAALSIDVVTLYTARSEAQLAADSAALAAARVLANSGMTSDTTGVLVSSAEQLAKNVAIQVATYNYVGGRKLSTANNEVTVTFNNGSATTATMVPNPHVTVIVQRTDLPTFFARMWGWTQIAVAASATAEAYNPSSAPGATTSATTPVAPMCVKPWLLPNMAPRGYPDIFNKTTGAIDNTSLLGWSYTDVPAAPLMSMATSNVPSAWNFYPGDQSSFPPPGSALPSCATTLPNPYQQSIAGCVQTSISCNSTATVSYQWTGADFNTTADAVNCLTHSSNNEGDQLTSTNPPTGPFQFIAGADNPLVQDGAIAAGTEIMVSDSLVTVPVFDNTSSPFIGPNTQVQIIGFVQLFLNPSGTASPPGTDTVPATVVNLAGCGYNATGTPILGNGASPVAVRLITPP